MIISDELLRSTIRQHLLNEKQGYRRANFNVDLRGESEEALPELEGEEWMPEEGTRGQTIDVKGLCPDQWDGVDPYAKNILSKWFDALNAKGYTVLRTCGYRTDTQQSNITSSGQSVAKAGFSPHNFGLAVDVNIKWVDKEGQKRQLKMASSKEDWSKVLDAAGWESFRSKIIWGGVWTKYDPVHFDVYPSFPSGTDRNKIANALNKKAKKSGEWLYSKIKDTAIV